MARSSFLTPRALWDLSDSGPRDLPVFRAGLREFLNGFPDTLRRRTSVVETAYSDDYPSEVRKGNSKSGHEWPAGLKFLGG